MIVERQHVIGDDIRRLRKGCAEQSLQPVRMHEVVAIEDCDPRATRNLQRAVAGCGRTGVRRCDDHTDARVLGGMGTGDPDTAVGRGIVDNDDLDRLQRLIAHRFKRRIEEA